MKFLSCGGELNHHGKYMCDEIYVLLGDNYKRINTSRVNSIRKEMGYKDENDLPYTIDGTELSTEEIDRWIEWADVIDYGNAPEIYLHKAIRKGKIVFIRIERLLKEGNLKLFYPPVRRKYNKKYRQYRNFNNVYYLCISAFAASDLKRIGVQGDHVLQWAYCPEFIQYENLSAHSTLIEPLKLFWCGRLIGWKHPEVAIKIADQLKNDGIDFTLDVAGIGELAPKLKNQIVEKDLSDRVKYIGSVKADEMRDFMGTKDIFITTSDRNEGWGVVINEAMNSGCAVLASDQMGAAPVLINDGTNGFLFSIKKWKKAVEIIENLNLDRKKLAQIRQNAYSTIKDSFSPEYYAKVFVEMANEALHGGVKKRTGLGEVAVIR